MPKDLSKYRTLNYLFKHLKIHLAIATLSFKRFSEYKADFLFRNIFLIIIVGIWFVFWDVIIFRFENFAGWNYNDLILITMFFFIFTNSFQILFPGVRRLGQKIVSGGIDQQLTKPVNSFFFTLVGFSFFHVHSVLLYLAVGIFIIFSGGYGLADVLIALAISLIGAGIYFCIRLILYLFFFLLGRDNPIPNIVLNLDKVGFYPIGIFSEIPKIFFVFVYPIAFISSIPADISRGGISGGDIISYFFISFTLLCFWLILLIWFWKYCLNRYESGGG